MVDRQVSRELLGCRKVFLECPPNVVSGSRPFEQLPWWIWSRCRTVASSLEVDGHTT